MESSFKPPENAAAENRQGRYRSAKGNHALLFTVIRRSLLVFGTVIAALLLTVYSLCFVVFLGPSIAARDKLVSSMLETSALKWVPGLFLPQSDIDAVLAGNVAIIPDAVTDADLVEIPSQSEDVTGEWENCPDGIRLQNINGDTYRGYALIIRDPSRVFVGTSSDYSNKDAEGITIMEAYSRENVVAATNAGGFPDSGGVGKGGVPLGLVMAGGKLLWDGDGGKYSTVIGFDNDNKLIVGSMSASEAAAKGMRDCVSFGPALVINGQGATFSGTAGGYNPRTAIGQRADGAVILLCIDGRMASSLGASFADLVDVMIELGAVNAGNLDGGSSTAMIWNGKVINTSSSLYGPRDMPTFIMVRAKED